MQFEHLIGSIQRVAKLLSVRQFAGRLADSNDGKVNV
jgi:hypothetical protein